MRKHVLLFGLGFCILMAALTYIEQRGLAAGRSAEFYGTLGGAVFMALGLWLGIKLTRRPPAPVAREAPVAARAAFVRDLARVASLGITPRELEVLELIAAGLGNREIAGRMSVSENTVKTHSSRVLDKLGVRRRAQALRRGRELRLIP